MSNFVSRQMLTAMG